MSECSSTQASRPAIDWWPDGEAAKRDSQTPSREAARCPMQSIGGTQAARMNRFLLAARAQDRAPLDCGSRISLLPEDLWRKRVVPLGVSPLRDSFNGQEGSRYQHAALGHTAHHGLTRRPLPHRRPHDIRRRLEGLSRFHGPAIIMPSSMVMMASSSHYDRATNSRCGKRPTITQGR